MKLDFIQDPGHGWLKVKKDLLIKLDIANKISSYSYMRGAYAYLEEDCDYSTFQAAMNNAGLNFTCRDCVSRARPSKIRSYAQYKLN